MQASDRDLSDRTILQGTLLGGKREEAAEEVVVPPDARPLRGALLIELLTASELAKGINAYVGGHFGPTERWVRSRPVLAKKGQCNFERQRLRLEVPDGWTLSLVRSSRVELRVLHSRDQAGKRGDPAIGTADLSLGSLELGAAPAEHRLRLLRGNQKVKGWLTVRVSLKAEESRSGKGGGDDGEDDDARSSERASSTSAAPSSLSSMTTNTDGRASDASNVSGSEDASDLDERTSHTGSVLSSVSDAGHRFVNRARAAVAGALQKVVVGPVRQLSALAIAPAKQEGKETAGAAGVAAGAGAVAGGVGVQGKGAPAARGAAATKPGGAPAAAATHAPGKVEEVGRGEEAPAVVGKAPAEGKEALAVADKAKGRREEAPAAAGGVIAKDEDAAREASCGKGALAAPGGAPGAPAAAPTTPWLLRKVRAGDGCVPPKGPKAAEHAKVRSAIYPGEDQSSQVAVDEDAERFKQYHQEAGTLGMVSARQAAKLPPGMRREPWIAAQVLDIHTDLQHLVSTLGHICTEDTCPRMGDGKVAWKWIDEDGHSREVSAPKYAELLMESAFRTLSDPAVMPAEGSAEVPEHFEATMKLLLKRFLRIYAHAYKHHAKQVLDHNILPHLMNHIKRFIFFVQEFDLVDAKDFACLRPVVDHYVEEDRKRQKEEEVQPLRGRLLVELVGAAELAKPDLNVAQRLKGIFRKGHLAYVTGRLGDTGRWHRCSPAESGGGRCDLDGRRLELELPEGWTLGRLRASKAELRVLDGGDQTAQRDGSAQQAGRRRAPVIGAADLDLGSFEPGAAPAERKLQLLRAKKARGWLTVRIGFKAAGDVPGDDEQTPMPPASPAQSSASSATFLAESDGARSRSNLEASDASSIMPPSVPNGLEREPRVDRRGRAPGEGGAATPSGAELLPPQAWKAFARHGSRCSAQAVAESVRMPPGGSREQWLMECLAQLMEWMSRVRTMLEEVGTCRTECSCACLGVKGRGIFEGDGGDCMPANIPAFAKLWIKKAKGHAAASLTASSKRRATIGQSEADQFLSGAADVFTHAYVTHAEELQKKAGRWSELNGGFQYLLFFAQEHGLLRSHDFGPSKALVERLALDLFVKLPRRTVVCPAGHDLRPYVVQFRRSAPCDLCGEIFSGGATVWDCTARYPHFTICESCRAEPPWLGQPARPPPQPCTAERSDMRARVDAPLPACAPLLRLHRRAFAEYEEVANMVARGAKLDGRRPGLRVRHYGAGAWAAACLLNTFQDLSVLEQHLLSHCPTMRVQDAAYAWTDPASMATSTVSAAAYLRSTLELARATFGREAFASWDLQEDIDDGSVEGLRTICRHFIRAFANMWLRHRSEVKSAPVYHIFKTSFCYYLRLLHDFRWLLDQESSDVQPLRALAQTCFK